MCIRDRLLLELGKGNYPGGIERGRRSRHLLFRKLSPHPLYFSSLFLLIIFLVPVPEVCIALGVLMTLKGSQFSEVAFDVTLRPLSWLPCPSALQIPIIFIVFSLHCPCGSLFLLSLYNSEHANISNFNIFHGHMAKVVAY